jgi:hypothetical protein
MQVCYQAAEQIYFLRQLRTPFEMYKHLGTNVINQNSIQDNLIAD